jgi:hypothetical protein
MKGELEIQISMPKLQSKGLKMEQKVYLKTGSGKYELIFFPNTKDIDCKIGTKVLVPGLKDGITLSSGSSYFIEGIIPKKEDIIKKSIDNDIGKQCVNFLDEHGLFPNRFATPEPEFYKDIMQATILKNFVYGEVLKKLIMDESGKKWILVKSIKGDPSSIKKSPRSSGGVST